jgi:hypothetical protein
MKSNLLKSLVALSLVASPTIAAAQTGSEAETANTQVSEDDNDLLIGAGFVAILFAVVLLVLAGDEGSNGELPKPVSP